MAVPDDRTGGMQPVGILAKVPELRTWPEA
jgi:hypothetical protein